MRETPRSTTACPPAFTNALPSTWIRGGPLIDSYATQARVASQTSPFSHSPHEPPQVSSPQDLPSHAGSHVSHVELGLQKSVPSHVPHVPPHPSLPQVLPSQSGVQACKRTQSRLVIPRPAAPTI